MKALALTLAVVFCMLSSFAYELAAQTPDPVAALLQEAKESAPKPAQGVAPSGDVSSDYGAYKIEEEKSRRILIGALLAASIVSLVIVLRFLTRNGPCGAMTIVNGSGMVLVIYATVMVVIIAKAEQQLTAAIGILGAIVGYLFGATAKAQGESGSTPASGR